MGLRKLGHPHAQPGGYPLESCAAWKAFLKSELPGQMEIDGATPMTNMSISRTDPSTVIVVVIVVGPQNCVAPEQINSVIVIGADSDQFGHRSDGPKNGPKNCRIAVRIKSDQCPKWTGLPSEPL